MTLKYATPTQTPNVDAFGNTIKSPDLVPDSRASAATPNTSSVSSQSQATKGNANLDGSGNRVTNDPVSNPNGKNNTNRVGGGGNSVGNRPSAPRPVNNPSTTAPNSTPSNSANPISSPATSASGLGAILNSPVAKALGALGLALSLADTASSLGSSAADTLSNADGTGTRNKAARKSLSDSNKRYDKALSDRQAANPTNSKGSGTQSGDPNYVLPFSGGQSVGIEYIVTVKAAFSDGQIQFSRGRNPANSIAELQDSTKPVTGAISGASIDSPDNFGTVYYRVNGDIQNNFQALNFRSSVVTSIQIVDIARADRQTDTGGDLGNPNPFTKYYEPPVDFYKNRESTDPDNPKSPNYFPYMPTISVGQSSVGSPPSTTSKDRQDLAPPPATQPNFAPSTSTSSSSNSTTSGSTSSGLGPLGLGLSGSTSSPSSSSTSSPSSSSPANNGMGGFTSTPATQTPASQTYANGMTNADYDRLAGRTPVPTTPLNPNVSPSQNPNPLTTPLNPPKPSSNPNPNSDPANLGNIATILGAIGLAITAITQRTNKIDGQTTPQAQQTNAKQGVCDAMQPTQCGFEGVKRATTEATNPIKDIANQNKGLLAGLAANLASILAAITSNFTKLFTFLDINAKVEAVKSTITLALTLHNALMLSQNLGTTIGAIIDNVLATFGQTFKTTEGATVSASEFLGASVKNWIINVIGIDNYLQLSETLAMANRIYQTGINVLSTVQGILDSAASVAQATGINVAKIGNALRDDGTINPKAYTHMDDTKAGNRPTTLGRFEQLTTTISDFDSKAQNLVTVTAAPIQVKEAMKQSKEDIKAFNDARNVNSEANKEAKLAKLEEIKALKAITEAVVSKKDDDT